MAFCKRIVFFIALFSFIATNAQEKPIGIWSALFPYNTAYGVTSDGTNLMVITSNAFYEVLNHNGLTMETYNKVNGMSDIGMQFVAYDAATGYTILVYTNGNIDLFKNKTFYNIPDFKLKSITGNKAVYHVYTQNGNAYISTSIGILVIDLAKQNIQETYQFLINNQVIPVTGFIGFNDSFYAITANGLFVAPQNSNELQNFAIWKCIDSTHSLNYISVFNNTLYLANQSAIYAYSGDTLQPVYQCPTTITHIDAGIRHLFISEYNPSTFAGYAKKLDTRNIIVDTILFPGYPSQITQLAVDSSVWVANNYSGLGNWADPYLLTKNPPGPADINSFNLYANNGSVWIAHGGYTDSYLPDNNGRGLSHFQNNNWTTYQQWQYAPFYDTLADFISVVKDENDGTLYAASFGNYGEGGLFQLNSDGSYKIYKSDVFERGSSSGGWELSGLAIDDNRNIWVTTYTSALDELYVKERSSGNWYKYHVNVQRSAGNDGGPLVVDELGEVWYICIFGQGIMAYNTQNTFAYPNDDTYRHFSTGVGTGNLPSNTCFSIAKDLTGDIWVGTDNGIGIIYQSTACISDNCDAVIPIVQYDAYAGYLFAGENVRAIAVDGANRKWVGTDNGVWLLSPDAGTIIYRFTVDNSPLPSNRMQSIAIDKVTGDVLFGTDQGLVSFRGTATQGGDTNHNVKIFPNPVQKGYTGTIAISGLVTNADVRITDIDGQLVYKTTAFGGQATWSGLDYKGHRPQSGVYLVFVSNTDNSNSGTQTYVGKIVFVQ